MNLFGTFHSVLFIHFLDLVSKVTIYTDQGSRIEVGDCVLGRTEKAFLLCSTWRRVSDSTMQCFAALMWFVNRCLVCPQAMLGVLARKSCKVVIIGVVPFASPILSDAMAYLDETERRRVGGNAA